MLLAQQAYRDVASSQPLHFFDDQLVHSQAANVNHATSIICKVQSCFQGVRVLEFWGGLSQLSALHELLPFCPFECVMLAQTACAGIKVDFVVLPIRAGVF